MRACRDNVDRFSRLCHAAGVGDQEELVGADATLDRVERTVMAAVARTGPGGMLVLTFSGHAQRSAPGDHGGGWHLHDGALRHKRTAALLAGLAPTAHAVVVADTCYGTEFANALAGVRALTVLLATCHADQMTLDYSVSEFVVNLERLTFPGGVAHPACTSYAWLRCELRRDTPDVERPEVRANRPGWARLRLFRPIAPDTHRQRRER